jgi:pimeloyl-ACP methyl ester carboxylesterase
VLYTPCIMKAPEIAIEKLKVLPEDRHAYAANVIEHAAAAEFDVLVIEAEQPGCVGLFAVGRGGNPWRHISLLRSIAGYGCTIIAPHVDMLASSVPTKTELDTRIRRLEAAADAYARTDLPIAGIGHSIGTVVLLAIAGGEARTLAGDRVAFGSKWKLARLALFAPPADFFGQPGALRSVNVPIRIWAGGKDRVTPPAQAVFLKEALASQAPVEVCLDEDAGHFTYMDEPPPHIMDPHPDRRTFLASLASDVGRFITARRSSA